MSIHSSQKIIVVFLPTFMNEDGDKWDAQRGILKTVIPSARQILTTGRYDPSNTKDTPGNRIGIEKGAIPIEKILHRLNGSEDKRIPLSEKLDNYGDSF